MKAVLISYVMYYNFAKFEIIFLFIYLHNLLLFN